MNINLEQLIALRHWLHAHPEVSRQEDETARHMRNFLAQYAKPDSIVPLGGAGFAAVYEGRSPGKTVLLRCELDALPIHEVNQDMDYRSLHDGVGHKCGHDGHMAILAGVAQTLAVRPQQGRVVLLFQPDEETGTGARLCRRHENFAKIQPDYVFALHNLPGFAAGDVVCKPGTFTAQLKYMVVTMTGREAHSAQPETGKSPSFALAELVLKARDIQARYDRPDAYALMVPVFQQMGAEASGICPGQGTVQFTLRSAQGQTVEQMWQDLQAASEALAAGHGLKVSFAIREEYKATVNGQIGFDMVRKAAQLTGHSFTRPEQPFRWSEDFSELTGHYEGAMFGLGAGETRPDLHNPDYDFPDNILPNGITMFSALIDLALAKHGMTD